MKPFNPFQSNIRLKLFSYLKEWSASEMKSAAWIKLDHFSPVNARQVLFPKQPRMKRELNFMGATTNTRQNQRKKREIFWNPLVHQKKIGLFFLYQNIPFWIATVLVSETTTPGRRQSDRWRVKQGRDWKALPHTKPSARSTSFSGKTKRCRYVF